MKYLISILVVSIFSGCATRKATKPESLTTVSGTALSRKTMPSVRIPETVKAYPVSRYTDPNFPEEMHDRHTVYRREQAPDWNYLPDPPYALPLGPTVANSNPSPDYYQHAEGETSARQRAYAEALQEQNRAMKKRIDSLQQEAGKVPQLQQEIDRLKLERDETPVVPVPPPQPQPVKIEEEDVFSSVEPPLPVADEFTDPGEIMLFAESDDQCQAFLISQMRLNDEFIKELAALERRKISAVLAGSFLRRKVALIPSNP